MTKKYQSASAKTRKAASAAPAIAASQSAVAAAATAEAAAPEMARIHHLSSYAVLSLPPKLRPILGEKDYAGCVRAFERQELEFLIHIDGNVIYLNSQIGLMPQRPAPAA